MYCFVLLSEILSRGPLHMNRGEFPPVSCCLCASQPGRQGTAVKINIIHSGNSTRRRRHGELTQNKPHPHSPRLEPVPEKKGPQIQSVSPGHLQQVAWIKVILERKQVVALGQPRAQRPAERALQLFPESPLPLKTLF